jgi:FtsZ-binding cell division protein ZapB
MGANLSCPNGFQRGVLFTCTVECPPEFKYIQEQGSVIGPPVEKCVYRSNNSLSVRLNPLPQLDAGQGVPTHFKDEKDRVIAEIETIKKTAEDQTIKRREYDENRYNYQREYENIKSQYTNWKELKSTQQKMREVKDSLKPFRPPTAPSSDLEKERKEITTLAKRNMFLAQIALFLVVLVGLSYVTLPRSTADMAALGLLTVGIALGFFLIR